VPAAAPVEPVEIAAVELLLPFIGAAGGLAVDVVTGDAGELVELLEERGVQPVHVDAGYGRHAASCGC
jgi:hypothetical protein